MVQGTLESLLTGERRLNDPETEIVDDGSAKMSQIQREKAIEILNYIKMQEKRRQSAMDYDLGIKQKYIE